MQHVGYSKTSLPTLTGHHIRFPSLKRASSDLYTATLSAQNSNKSMSWQKKGTDSIVLIPLLFGDQHLPAFESLEEDVHIAVLKCRFEQVARERPYLVLHLLDSMSLGASDYTSPHMNLRTNNRLTESPTLR